MSRRNKCRKTMLGCTTAMRSVRIAAAGTMLWMLALPPTLALSGGALSITTSLPGPGHMSALAHHGRRVRPLTCRGSLRMSDGSVDDAPPVLQERKGSEIETVFNTFFVPDSVTDETPGDSNGEDSMFCAIHLSVDDGGMHVGVYLSFTYRCTHQAQARTLMNTDE